MATLLINNPHAWQNRWGISGRDIYISALDRQHPLFLGLALTE